jgi:hypothetical protein
MLIPKIDDSLSMEISFLDDHFVYKINGLTMADLHSVYCDLVIFSSTNKYISSDVPQGNVHAAWKFLYFKSQSIG